MSFNFKICPLTGLALNNQASLTPYKTPTSVLYQFPPIGRGVFSLGQMITLGHQVEQPGFRPRTDLAGICRVSTEREEEPVVITQKMFNVPADQVPYAEGLPYTFEEKSKHLLGLLYDIGGNEHRKRDLFIHTDFPMAYASDGNEFHRIVEALVDEGLLRFDKPNDTLNDWPFGIRAVYYGILLTPVGKRAVLQARETQSIQAPSPVQSTAITMRKVFISHASADKKIADELVELLELVGVPAENIFYTSLPEHGITPGQDFLARIKAEISEDVLVLFALSPNFYNSPVCLCEMGAAWVLSRTHIPVVIPPFSFGDIKGVIPLTQGVMVNDAGQINSLSDTVANAFGLPAPRLNPAWERKRNRILGRINESIDLAAQEAAKREEQSRKIDLGGPRGGSQNLDMRLRR